MMKHEEVQFVLDDGPEQDFTGSKLQIENEGSLISPNKQVYQNANEFSNTKTLSNGNIPGKNNSDEIQSDQPPNEGKVRPNSLAVVPWSGENARDFFSYRDGLVTNAVKECVQALTSEDGENLGSWLLTEISFWDHEKERLVLLTTTHLYIIKYDFIALKKLEHRKISLDSIDTIVIGELSYPAASLIPSRKMSGVRAMWNGGEPLSFIKKWNPFEKAIPFATFTSHPLLWHKDDNDTERRMYNVDDFTSLLTISLERRQKNFQCIIQHKPILLENYIGLSSLIHNKNSLGFFKVRGKFSF